MSIPTNLILLKYNYYDTFRKIARDEMLLNFILF